MNTRKLNTIIINYIQENWLKKINYDKFYPRKLNNLIKDEFNGIQVTNYHNRST